MSMNAAETLLSVGDDKRAALECGDSSLTYSGLRDAVRRAAGAWRTLGLETGDRVLVHASDGIDWVVAYLGVIWAGGVAVGLNSRLFDKDLSIVLADCGARFVFCDPGGVATLQRLLRNEVAPPCIVTQAEARALWSTASPIPAEPRRTSPPPCGSTRRAPPGFPRASSTRSAR
jgi:acyl-CoA synthetase (AMP-forming)/AMP-acid ligase II